MHNKDTTIVVVVTVFYIWIHITTTVLCRCRQFSLLTKVVFLFLIFIFIFCFIFLFFPKSHSMDTNFLLFPSSTSNAFRSSKVTVIHFIRWMHNLRIFFLFPFLFLFWNNFPNSNFDAFSNNNNNNGVFLLFCFILLIAVATSFRNNKKIWRYGRKIAGEHRLNCDYCFVF